MPRPEQDAPEPPAIPQPIEREPDAYVENIYSVPGTMDTPDLASQDEMGQHLIARRHPREEPKTRVILTPSGYTLPSLDRVPSGIKEVTRWRRLNPKEYIVSWRESAAVILGSAAIFGVAANADTVVEGSKYVGHKIYRVFDPVEDRTVSRQVEVNRPGKTKNISMTITSGNRVGESTIDSAKISSFVQKVRKAQQNGGTVLRYAVRSNTSDEFGSDASIGTPNEGNTEIGKARARAAVQALSRSPLKVKPADIARSEKEHVLSSAQKNRVQEAASDAGYSSITGAISAADAGTKLPSRLSRLIKRYFTDKENRGVTVTASIESPGEDTTGTETVTTIEPGKDKAPDVPGPSPFGFIPLFPIRRRERYTKVKQLHRWQFTPAKPVWRPEILREDKDEAWLRIRPEAIREDGSFVDNAWAYTRTYEYLLRDDRIADVLRADYKDARGNDKSLRVMFVDAKPAKETIKAFSNLLTACASMEEGKLGSRISGIFVFPSENTGTEHNDPKRIGLGIDRQYDENVLGHYVYALDLIETHMPTSCDLSELRDILDSFDGPIFTTGHEAAGHGTDESDEPLRARRVRTRDIPNAYVIDGEPRAFKMRPLEKILKKLPMFKWEKKEKIMFDITYTAVDNNGDQVPCHARVSEDDPLLAIANEATIVGYRTTRYAGTNESEHYAETAASVTTGIPVSFEEASVTVPERITRGGKKAVFAKGYRPDTLAQKSFTDSVGGQTGSFPITFKNPAKVAIAHIEPEDDPLIRQEMIRARRDVILPPDQMKAILVRMARRMHSNSSEPSRK